MAGWYFAKDVDGLAYSIFSFTKYTSGIGNRYVLKLHRDNPVGLMNSRSLSFVFLSNKILFSTVKTTRRTQVARVCRCNLILTLPGEIWVDLNRFCFGIYGLDKYMKKRVCYMGSVPCIDVYRDYHLLLVGLCTLLSKQSLICITRSKL